LFGLHTQSIVNVTGKLIDHVVLVDFVCWSVFSFLLSFILYQLIATLL